MRGTRGALAATLAIVAGALSIAGASPVQAGSNTAQLEAQRAQLLQQLAALTPAREAASQALQTAEAAYSHETAGLSQARSQLTSLNTQLANLAAQIDQDRAQEAAARSALAALARASYESASDNTLVTAVLSAKDFNAAMNSLSATATVTTEIQGLETTLARAEQDLLTKQRTAQADFAQASALENKLADESSQIMATVYARDQAVAALSGPARQIAAQIAQIDNELSGQAVPTSGSCSNRFAYGECTWYVATRRCIPWGGNADSWYYNAAAMGYREGSVPEVGAVAVWWPGRGGASWLGHVAYVEAVGPADGIPAGSFEVSEMNWAAWDRVDYRVVQNDPSVIQGFIY